jgi:hypothetical protein
MGVHGFSESYSRGFYEDHPELHDSICPVCGDVPMQPERCAICAEKTCHDCGSKGIDFPFACKSHPRLTTEHDIEIRAVGKRITRTLRHTWLRGDGVPLIERTELVSVAGQYHEDAAWFWDIEDSEMDRAINRFLLMEEKGGDSANSEEG